jgi:hypothetical protein
MTATLVLDGLETIGSTRLETECEHTLVQNKSNNQKRSAE